MKMREDGKGEKGGGEKRGKGRAPN